jgi:hypothetical protein
MRSYERMYREISRQIVLGGAGDSAASVKGAAELALRLEERDERLRDSHADAAGKHLRRQPRG